MLRRPWPIATPIGRGFRRNWNRRVPDWDVSVRAARRISVYVTIGELSTTGSGRPRYILSSAVLIPPSSKPLIWVLENKRLALRYDQLGFIIQSLLQTAYIFLVAGRVARELWKPPLR